MMPATGMDEFNMRRFLGTLNAIVQLLKETDANQKWVDWFQGDYDNFLSAKDRPGKASRQMAVVEHVMSAFGGMSDFKQIELNTPEKTDKLQNLSTQLWSASRGLQGTLLAEMQE